MPYADILLVYDLLGAAIARGQLDVAQYDGKYTRSEVLSCLCMSSAARGGGAAGYG